MADKTVRVRYIPHPCNGWQEQRLKPIVGGGGVVGNPPNQALAR